MFNPKISCWNKLFCSTNNNIHSKTYRKFQKPSSGYYETC